MVCGYVPKSLLRLRKWTDGVQWKERWNGRRRLGQSNIPPVLDTCLTVHSWAFKGILPEPIFEQPVRPLFCLLAWATSNQNRSLRIKAATLVLYDIPDRCTTPCRRIWFLTTGRYIGTMVPFCGRWNPRYSGNFGNVISWTVTKTYHDETERRCNRVNLSYVPRFIRFPPPLG